MSRDELILLNNALNEVCSGLEELAASGSGDVRMLLAARPDLPQLLIDRLAADPDAKVLKAIAPNPGVGTDALERMLSHHGQRVAVRVGTNPNCTPTLLDSVLT